MKWNTRLIKQKKEVEIMLKTKLSTAIILVAMLSLLLAPAVHAATTTGSFTAGGTKPTVDSIGVYSDSGCSVTVTKAAPMGPLTEYWAKLTVTSKSKLSNLKTVQVTIYYDSAGTHLAPVGGGNTQTLAVFTWHADGVPTTWEKASGSPSTWTVETAGCIAPSDLTLKTGDWKFAFKPGKVATQTAGSTDWDAEGIATSKQDTPSDANYYTAMGMNFYSEVAVTGTVDWGSVALGLKFDDSPPNSKTVSNVNYIANGNYNENVKSSASWTAGADSVAIDETGGNPPTADGEFAIKADDTATLGSAVIVKNSTATAIDNTGTITSEGGDDVTTNNLWLSLSAEGIVPATYTGQIYYEVSNRP
jgi:hypothetical protein